MARQIGTFSAEGAFQLTGRGWVVVGTVEGQVAAGNQLVFPDGTVLHIVGTNAVNTHTAERKFGLLISESFATRQVLVDRGLIEATARILE